KMLIEKSNKTADKISVLTNKIIKTFLLIKTFLVTNKIIKTLSLITKLVKTSLLVIKIANLDYVAPLVIKNRKIINNLLSRVLVLKSRYERFFKKKTLINKIILVVKILK